MLQLNEKIESYSVNFNTTQVIGEGDVGSEKRVVEGLILSTKVLYLKHFLHSFRTLDL